MQQYIGHRSTVYNTLQSPSGARSAHAGVRVSMPLSVPEVVCVYMVVCRAVRSPVGFVWRAMRVPCVSPVSVRPPCVFPSSTAPSLSVSCPVRIGPVSVRFERSLD